VSDLVELCLFICFSSYFHPSVLSSDIFIIGSHTIFGFYMDVAVLTPADLLAVAVFMAGASIVDYSGGVELLGWIALVVSTGSLSESSPDCEDPFFELPSLFNKPSLSIISM